MSFNATRGPFDFGRAEFLKYPTGLHAIQSVVISAADVASTSASSSPYFGRRIIVAGTILTKVPGASTYRRYTSGASEAPVGILGLDLEVVDTSANSNQPAPMYYHGCVFNQNNIVDFATYSAPLKAAMPTCKFEA
jgi:hypothetical protein